jgi:tetratricopeptide (TPR) repeat protein
LTVFALSYRIGGASVESLVVLLHFAKIKDVNLMSDEPQQKANEENPYHEQIGEAWKNHRKGFQDKAIEQFRAVLNEDPSNLDAMYGLALAKKAAGNLIEAKQTFEQLAEVLEQYASQDLSAGSRERIFMLRSMVTRLHKQLETE